ncbi:unnamed protein product [Rhizophagus irregularis]|nr:unnamed protein product [Rhizophagus irregularis]
MDISNQKLDTTEITIRNNSKPDAKNLWKEIEDEDDEYQKKEKDNDFLNEVKYYISEPVNSTDYLSSFQEPISSSSANPISECLDCELNELDLNQDDDE